ncbi:MAG: TIGR04053 family radical SAM/SPASM domain-containing protein [Gemmatimonadota bacterium]
MSESSHLAVPTSGRPDILASDFDRAPFLVIWETTQACDLACIHCRAGARPYRDCGELSTLEAMNMMNRIRRFGRPLFVLTGGDPAKRPDLVDLVAHGARLGLRMGLTPSGTPLVTAELVRELRDAGLSRLAVSLDGPTPESHDRFRGVAGSYDWTIGMLEMARDLGISTQVNSTVSRGTLSDFDAMGALVRKLGIALWSVFFLVPIGRGRSGDLPSPDELERVFHRMYDLSLDAPFDVKSTAAPQYRRVVLERQVASRRQGERNQLPSPLTGGVGFSLADGVGRARGVNDGNGFLFISHRGDLFPSGFLPVSAGNIRTDDPVAVYRDHELFRALRNPDLLKGKCGICEYRSVCGGSRARAWALTGDALEADPSCAHVPAQYLRMVGRGEAQEVDVYFRQRIPGWGARPRVGELPTPGSGNSRLPTLCSR